MRGMGLALAVLLGVALGTAARAQPGTDLPQCPDDYEAFKEETDPLTCRCPADATGRGSVWGTDVYTSDSSVCRAALHAGMVGRRGGAVTVVGAPGRRSYYGTTRNGLSSSNYGPYDSSFRFTGAPAPAPVPSTAEIEPCPDSYSAVEATGEPLVCTCEAGAGTEGSVWGTDTYTADSHICRAALHAGVTGEDGGQVTVTSEPGRARYAGTTRNGVTTSSYGSYGASFRFARTTGKPGALGRE